ncbi:MAG: hypothetical protein E4H09_04045, partial [Spirochaetales bacterium]
MSSMTRGERFPVSRGLENDWRSAMGVFGISGPLAAETYHTLMSRYEEPGRAYHNKDHIAHVMAILGDLESRDMLAD